MLYLLHGTNQDEARRKGNELLESLQKKKPDAAVFKLDAEKWSAAFFEELIGGQGLFERKYIVYVGGVFENKDIKEYVVGNLKAVAEPPNIFIFVEGEVDKATRMEFEKVADKVQVFSEKGKDKSPFGNKKEFNIFSITDAFGRRDRKEAWVLYQKALAADISPEEVHGILFWQVKNIAVVQEARDSKESGLSPFVFMKAKQFASRFKEGEIETKATELVSLFHEGRRGGSELDIALERFILSI